jgi:hypothetical protein
LDRERRLSRDLLRDLLRFSLERDRFFLSLLLDRDLLFFLSLDRLLERFFFLSRDRLLFLSFILEDFSSTADEVEGSGANASSSAIILSTIESAFFSSDSSANLFGIASPGNFIASESFSGSLNSDCRLSLLPAEGFISRMIRSKFDMKESLNSAPFLMSSRLKSSSFGFSSAR